MFNSSYFRKIKQTHDRGRFHLSLQTTASTKRGKTILISVKKPGQAEQIVEAEDRGFNQWSVAKFKELTSNNVHPIKKKKKLITKDTGQ